MALDMRVPNGRCPPLLFGGIVFLYIILICNWWSLSSKNFDLLTQIDNIQEQINICIRERDEYVIDKNTLEESLGKEKANCDDSLKKKEINLAVCKSELESLKNVDASKNESLNFLRSALEDKEEKLQLFKNKLNSLTKELKSQNQGTTDNKVDDIENNLVKETTDTQTNENEKYLESGF